MPSASSCSASSPSSPAEAQMKRAPKRPFADEAAASDAVRGFPVRRRIETLALVFFRDAQADSEIDELEGDERHHAGPEDRQADCLRLNPELLGDRGVARRAG